MADSIALNTARGTARKKAVEACERCRGKRIKCNGLQPCNQCTIKSLQCDFAIAPLPAPGDNEALREKLDLVLARLANIEQRLDRQVNISETNASPGRSAVAAKPQLLALHPQTRGIVKLNQQTGCFEYYGRTSTFQIASALGKRFGDPHEASGDSSNTKKRRIELGESPPDSPGMAPKSLDLDELTSFCDYIVPPHAVGGERRLQVHIADRHLENFFSTIHIFLPVLDKTRFKSRYNLLRTFFGDKRLVLATADDSSRPQFVCLLYAVLALGALYENGQEDTSVWASWYFAEAQGMLGRLLDASNLDLIQAAMFLGAYAQHAIKPNLAYNLNGIAARLAYSIGLNVESLHRSLGFEKEEARRTWTIIYIQEVELSIDAGRPMSIHSSDMEMNYPTVQLPATNESRTDAAQVVFISHLANISKIVRRILKLSGVHEERPLILLLEERESLRQQLERWRNSLPDYLSINDNDSEMSGDDITGDSFLRDWRARQQSSLRIHFNLANIILLRNALSIQDEMDPGAAGCPLIAMHRKLCLDAARDTITHIHRSFEIASGLRRWSYYCFYCLQATLVLLPQIADEGAADGLLCKRAVEVFEQIKLKASQRCAEVVRQHLVRRARSRHRQRDQGTTTKHAVDVGMHSQSPLPATSASKEQCAPILDHTPSTKLHQTRGNANPSLDLPCCTNELGSTFSLNSSSTWPSVSPNTLQTEMYDALYSIDSNEDLYLGHQPYFFGTGGLSNDVMTSDTNWPLLWTD